jgi:hypothetical protein
MRKTILAGALAAGALAVAVGSASTARSTIAPSVAGYGSSTISGASATSLVYTLSADGKTIIGADLIFTGNVTTRTVQAGFGTANLTPCDVAQSVDGSGNTPVTCGGFSQDTAASATFNVAVS